MGCVRFRTFVACDAPTTGPLPRTTNAAGPHPFHWCWWKVGGAVAAFRGRTTRETGHREKTTCHYATHTCWSPPVPL
eukprot:5520848-Prorocentrum_lima.AAC.1